MASLRDPELLKRIISFIEMNVGRISNDEKVFSILEENIKPHVVEKLRHEIISDRAFNISKERVPPINIFKLVNKRLSKIYSDAPIRKTESTSDQKLVDLYELKAFINSSMNSCNYITNAQRRSALEPYLDNGKPRVRVIPAQHFLVYSENVINNLNMEVFIKILGTIQEPREEIDATGNRTTIIKEVQLYHLYTDTEFLIMDGDGTPRLDLMITEKGKRLKLSGGVAINPDGIIPFIYVNSSEYQLMPATNIDDIELVLLLLALLTDLNYAVKYQAHSMIYMINVDSTSIDMNPDAILDLKSDAVEGEKVEVGVIKPEIDIEATLRLIASTLKLYLESKGLKVDIDSSISSGDAASGIHETIKNASLIEERKDQINLYNRVEDQLWDLIAIKQKRWRNKQLLKGDFKKSTFSDDFDILVIYGEQKPTVSRRDKGLMLQTEVEAGLTSQKKAIKEIHPELSDDELEEEIKQIKKEREEGITASNKGGNDNNDKLAAAKRNKDGSNGNATAQNENPNKR